MRTIGRGTLLAAGALGVALATAGYGSAAGSFAAAAAGELDLAAVSAPAAYTLVEPDEGAGYVDPATGEAPSACRTGELRISSRGGSLVFENITGHACSLQGHPGVSSFAAVGAGAPAVLLAPGDRLQAAVETCEAGVRVRGYEVSAPGDTKTVFVSAPHEACSTGTVDAFTAIG
jgi:hypothetical protein